MNISNINWEGKRLTKRFKGEKREVSLFAAHGSPQPLYGFQKRNLPLLKDFAFTYEDGVSITAGAVVSIKCVFFISP